jgi:hypothetical protein
VDLIPSASTSSAQRTPVHLERIAALKPARCRVGPWAHGSCGTYRPACDDIPFQRTRERTLSASVAGCPALTTTLSPSTRAITVPGAVPRASIPMLTTAMAATSATATILMCVLRSADRSDSLTSIPSRIAMVFPYSAMTLERVVTIAPLYVGTQLLSNEEGEPYTSV